jgi:serine/threonine protein phosphatase 1
MQAALLLFQQRHPHLPLSRTLVIGDIHGCYTALTTLAERVPFQPEDLIITLGDYVDRGPDSRQVLQWLIQRHSTGQLIALRGNHECLMLEARHNSVAMNSWLNDYIGGQATVDSYAPANHQRAGRLTDVPEAHWRFLQHETRRYHETETHLYVHANADPRLPLASQSDAALYWQHLDRDKQQPHLSGKTLICGHTAQRTGQILNLGHTLCLDTAAASKGWLTCLAAATGEYWQANQQGEFRTARLTPPDRQP